MLKWVAEIWSEILIFQLKMKNTISLGNATTHKTSKVKDKIMKLYYQ